MTNGHVSLWSSQRNAVVDKLLRGEAHIQRREDSAACDRSLRPSLWRGHRRAYAFVVSEFQKQRSQTMAHAPSWFSFANSYDFERHAYTQRLAIERVIEVRLPTSALFVFQHGENWEKMLIGSCLEKEIPRVHRPETCDCPWRKRFQSWQRILVTDGIASDKLQAITDRIEPAWLRRVLWLDVRDGSFVDREDDAVSLIAELAAGRDPFANQATFEQVRDITAAEVAPWLAAWRHGDSAALGQSETESG